MALFDAVSESDATRKRVRGAPRTESVTVENRRLGECAAQYQSHLRTNDYCLNSAALVLAIGACEDFFNETYFGALRRALGVPAKASQLTRALALVERIDACIVAAEKLAECHRGEISAAQASSGCVSGLLLVRQSKLDSTVDTLRLVRRLKATRATRPTAHVQLLRGVYEEMSANFCDAFDVERFGTITAPAVPGEECRVCCEPFDPQLAHRARLTLDCCSQKQSICVACLMQHAYTKTNVAQKTFFSCPFCNHEHTIETPQV